MAAEHAAERAQIAEVRWNPALGLGLGAGAACGVALYVITLNVLPWAYKTITVVK
jgi:AAT family amino acid transporter